MKWSYLNLFRTKFERFLKLNLIKLRIVQLIIIIVYKFKLISNIVEIFWLFF